MARLDPDKISSNISKNLQELHEKRGLSLQGLADLSGITKSHLWELENGVAINPTIITLVKLSNALSVSLASLLTCRPRP